VVAAGASAAANRAAPIHAPATTIVDTNRRARILGIRILLLMNIDFVEYIGQGCGSVNRFYSVKYFWREFHYGW
jgi:hypothetical protein